MTTARPNLFNVLLLMLLALGACSADTASGDDADPRFATAEALVEHFNALNTKQPSDLPGILSLYHLESDFQRKKWELLNRTVASHEHDVDVAMYEKFGQPLIWSKNSKRVACTPAVLTNVAELRAEGVYNDWLGVERPLHLIKIGDHWWVSGYTLEYATDTDKREFNEEFMDAALEWENSMDFLPALAARIRSGEFTTAEEARQALFDAVRDNIRRRNP
jgi:hypothetical protein